MKKSLLKFLAIGIVAASVLVGCKKDDTTTPDYVGTWSRSVTVNSITTKFSVVLTKDTYEYRMTTNNIVIEARKAAISVSGASISATVTELGTGINVTTGNLSPTYYKDGTSEFATLLGSNPKTYKGEYIVAGNQLSINMDTNGDGNYTSYEKQLLTKE